MLPKVNKVLYLQVASYDEEEAKEEYKSRIADVHDDYISMEVPINVNSGRLKRLYPGDQLSAYFVSDGGVKHFFNTQVLGFKEDVVRLMHIKKPEPESITTVQRRNFLRVSAALEIAVKLTEQIQFLAMTDDVGGGGLAFICNGSIPLKMKDRLSCWLLIHYRNGSVDHVPFRGEIVRIKALENGKQLAMISFTDIMDSDRQKVIRFCFERQLDFRKK